MQNQRVFVALGSNLHNPQLQVEQAITQLARDFPQGFVASPLVTSAPMGPQDQPDYVNAVVSFVCNLSPFALLSHLQQLEKSQGKVKLRHWGERIIDLDLLTYGDYIIDTPELTLPHPGILWRDFVLQPLAGLAKQGVVLNYPGVHLANLLQHSIQVSSIH